MSTPCRLRPAGFALARRVRTFAPRALVGLLVLASLAFVRVAGATTSTSSFASGPRVWVGGGPFFPHEDIEHWRDPKGGAVASIGVGASVCPAAVLGFEADTWFGSYAAPTSATADVKAGTRMHGRFIGIGPTALMRSRYLRWDPWVSATLLFVNEHLGYTTSGGSDAFDSEWKGTFAVGAGLGYRIWENAGLEIRYQHIPLEANFDARSNGSGDVTVDAVMLSFVHEGPWPRWFRGKGGASQ